MSPIVKVIIRYAIVTLESAISILTIIPGNQGEEVLRMVVVALKALIAGSDAEEAAKAARDALKSA